MLRRTPLNRATPAAKAWAEKRAPLPRRKQLARTSMKRRPRKPKATDDPERLEFVRRLPCAACGRRPRSHPHHPILLGRGKSQKAPDSMAIPLCESSPATGRLGCHDALHERKGIFKKMNRGQLRAWQLARVDATQDLYELATNPMRRAV